MGRSAAISLPHHNAALSSASQRAGSPAKLAEAIGVQLHKVVEWIGGSEIAAALCPAIEQATGVTCDDLRPDLLWVRDGSGEILAFATPVDGADAAYVRQTLASSQVEPVATERAASPEPRVDTVFDAELLSVEGKDGGDVALTIDVGMRRATVVLDTIEAAKVAGLILDERDRVMRTIPAGAHEHLAEIPHALLPMRVHLEENGLHMDVSILDQGSTATVFRQRDHGNWYCILKIGGTELKLERGEADALAYALSNGNDGSGIAHVTKLACADMSEAIKLLRGGEITGVSGEDVANKLARKVSQLLDLHYQYGQHTYRRHGNLRAGRAPAVEAADLLGECARRAIEVISTVCGAMARGNWKDEHGNELTKRGMYRDLREAQRALDAAANEVMVKSKDTKAPKVEWRNPLEAQTMKADAHHVSYMTNLEWKPDSEATVSNCLEEASLTISTACKIILGNMYDESEDQMSMLLGMAKASVACAHSKLIQFASEGRDES